MSAEVMTVEISTDGVAIVTLDDGKVNAISPTVIAGVTEVLDSIEIDKAASALVIAGRPGQFSAGFDLKTIMAGREQRNDLISGGWNLLIRIMELPVPVVIACTGNAVAAGAGVLLTGDVRIGADGDFKLGFNETAIGLPIPGTLVVLTEKRLARDEVFEATVGARLYSPHEGVRVGFLHEVVPPDAVIDRAVERATSLGGLPSDAFATTKKMLLQSSVEAMKERVAADWEMLDRLGG